MQSRKQHQRNGLRCMKNSEHSSKEDPTTRSQDPRELVTRVSITKKVSKKNLTAKSPLRFTNKYRRTPTSVDLNERRALRRVIARDLTDQDRLKEVLAQIDRARALPKTSKYARHKLEILGKAKQLLEEKIEKREHPQGGQDADGELETLLRELRID